MKEILILGNAVDRLKSSKWINEYSGIIWGCNNIFKEDIRIDAIGTVHEEDATNIMKYKKETGKNFRIISFFEIENEIEVFKNFRGWSSWTEMIHQAILEGYTNIWLSGFIFIGGNEYEVSGPKLYCGNFRDQYEIIKKEFPNIIFKFVPYDPVEDK